MKIKVEGRVKDMLMDLELRDREDALTHARPKYTPDPRFDRPARKEPKPLIDQFKYYCNHRRGPISIDSNYVWLHSKGLLDKMKAGFEKQNPAYEVVVSSEYAGGEYRYKIKDVIRKEGE